MVGDKLDERQIAGLQEIAGAAREWYETQFEAITHDQSERKARIVHAKVNLQRAIEANWSVLR